MGFQMPEFEFKTFLLFFTPSLPPPFQGHCTEIFPFLIMMASLIKVLCSLILTLSAPHAIEGSVDPVTVRVK